MHRTAYTSKFACRLVFLFFMGLVILPANDGLLAASDLVVEPLHIASANGHHSFQVEIADTGPARQMGLMHRQRLGDDQGMLFLFPRSHFATFWMKDTPLSLDMLFIDEAGMIVDMAERTTPLSLTMIRSKVPAIAVLEIIGGSAEAKGIAIGDRVVHSAFSPP